MRGTLFNLKSIKESKLKTLFSGNAEKGLILWEQIANTNIIKHGVFKLILDLHSTNDAELAEIANLDFAPMQKNFFERFGDHSSAAVIGEIV